MVKLDWDIAAEQGKHRRHQEEAKSRRRRFVGFFRLLLVVGVIAGLLGFGVYLLSQRWEQVNERTEQLLVETVRAEVAALRSGQRADFMNIQRSGTEDWRLAQELTFERYERLMAEAEEVVLTGQVLDVAIDGRRARVQVQEIIDGVPYVLTWFYWRWDDELDENGNVTREGGWYHVPPDYTFWGETRRLERERFMLRYRAVDEPMAQQMAQHLERWFAEACAFLPCDELPPITVDILNSPLPDARWADNEAGAWQLALASPYIGRARLDQPFDSARQLEVATLFATRLVDRVLGNMDMQFPSDAYYLRDATITWLTGRFVQLRTPSTLIESIADNYGTDAIAALLANLQPDARLSVLASSLGAPTIAELTVDWSAFLRWRLQMEADFIEQGNRDAVLLFYDLRDSALIAAVDERVSNRRVERDISIVGVTQAAAVDGTPQLHATVQFNDGTQVLQQVIVFNLVDGTWLRAS